MNPNDETIQRLTVELEAMAAKYKERSIRKLQLKVLKWARLFNLCPRFLRPICLHYFGKWADRLNNVVTSFYPTAPGAPAPVVELLEAATLLNDGRISLKSWLNGRRSI